MNLLKKIRMLTMSAKQKCLEKEVELIKIYIFSLLNDGRCIAIIKLDDYESSLIDICEMLRKTGIDIPFNYVEGHRLYLRIEWNE